MLLRNSQLALVSAALRRSHKMVLETSTRTATASVANSAVAKSSPNLSSPRNQQLPASVQAGVENYENAVKTLNSLQSNYSVLQSSTNRKHNADTIHILETVKFLERIGISLEALDSLPVIHISGTKGKGSTCSLVESILRNHGYRTGFFSSPHLVSVTERIRLDGIPIDTAKFSSYFWNVYNQLLDRRDHARDLPAYFNFLTILAFEVFLREQVDVAIIEVGIGGKFDCTNVVRGTKTVGITSLGLEHTKLLGNVIEDIAWQKAGIIKERSDVFTVRQPERCLGVIATECKNQQANLHLVPDFDSYRWLRKPSINANNLAVKLNTSLAIQIALNWITHTRAELLPLNSDVLSEQVSRGIETCFWPGRCHQIRKNNKRIFLDGAHTVESIEICAKWFQTCQLKANPSFLIFNTTGDRDTKKLLDIIANINHFDEVFFSPNVASQQSTNIDSINLNFPKEEQMRRCMVNRQHWQDILSKYCITNTKTHVCPSVESVMEQIDNNYSDDQECDILVTGSLHLIGAVLTTLKMETQVITPG